MICSSCNGPVTWRGPITALTHTECADCGAINNQTVEPEADEDEDNGDAVACSQGLIQSWQRSR